MEWDGKRYHLAKEPGLKLVVDAGFTCPHGRCTFCDNAAFHPAYSSSRKSIAQQLDEGIAFHAARGRSHGPYLAYFQSFSNTFAPLERLQEVYADSRNMKGFMETIFRKGEGHKIYFFAILGPDDKSKAAGYEAFNLFTGYRDGIHLGGNVAQDPYLSFEYMSYADRMKLEAPGIGLNGGGELLVGIEWFCRYLLNLQVSACDGTVYVTDHFSTLSANLADVIRELLYGKLWPDSFRYMDYREVDGSFCSFDEGEVKAWDSKG